VEQIQNQVLARQNLHFGFDGKEVVGVPNPYLGNAKDVVVG
jgi:hypothetical protein